NIFFIILYPKENEILKNYNNIKFINRISKFFISIDKRIVENLLERILVFYSKKFNFTFKEKI
ncbi:hypothetical protein LRS55_13880, partial [Campylobacter coli]|nr:hypothetical protein [Campylobacter coli]